MFVAGADAGSNAYAVNFNNDGNTQVLGDLTVNSGNLTFNTQGTNWLEWNNSAITTVSGASLNVVGGLGWNAGRYQGGLVDFNTHGSSTICIAGVSNGGQMRKDGPGTLTLTGQPGSGDDTNSKITINQGTVVFSNCTPAFDSTNSITVNGGTVEFNLTNGDRNLMGGRSTAPETSSRRATAY